MWSENNLTKLLIQWVLIAKEFRLKEITSQTVGGLFLNLHFVACMDSNELTDELLFVECVSRQIMLLYALRPLYSSQYNFSV